MATKTIVCPDCGSEAPRGRYTCAECGAFLAGVAVAPRARHAEPVADAPAVAETLPAAAPAVAETLPAAALPEPVPAPGPEAAPAVDMATEPDAADEPHDDEAMSGWLADAPGSHDEVDFVQPPAVDVPSVQWPPAGDRGPLPAPEPRVPAGAYLPPSALLVGLEAPATAGGGTAIAATSSAARRPDAAPSRPWLETLGTPERRWAASRRTIAIGATVAVLGFFLPWASASPAALVNVWLSVWGLAGAGHWLIVLGLLAVGGLAALAGRLESLPLGVPAIALGALVLGLTWPTVFGAANRPIGVLVVVVGAIVLVVGGAIQLGARHEAATPDV